MKTFAMAKRVHAPSIPTISVCRPHRSGHGAAIRSILRPPGVQAKLTIGAPDSPYEREAERVARQVLDAPAHKTVTRPGDLNFPAPLTAPSDLPEIRRQPEKVEEEDELIMPRRLPGAGGDRQADVDADIHATQGRGQPLSAAARAFFEPRFGLDFSDVRIHTGEPAATLARKLGAAAFTVGRDIYFGRGQYGSNLGTGRNLLAHELVHVVQQRGRAVMPDPCQRNREGTAVAPLDRSGIIQREGRGRRGRRRSGILINIDSRPATIDQSMGVDDITYRFYRIPIELLPPRTPIPAPPILTIGRYGCSLRRYGLTVDDFAITYRLDDADVTHSARPSIGGSLVQCWAWRVRFGMRLRQRILLPDDLATHPCLEGVDPRREREDILAHERLHEGDNQSAAEEVGRSLRTRLSFMPGIGQLLAMVRITDDPEAFVEACIDRLHERLERLRDDHEMMYARISTEFAIQRDPHDDALHRTKLRLFEEARARRSASR